MSKASLLRLGLFQLTAGGLSVLFLGVLNRVMRVELGLDLFVVSLLVGGGHYLGALAAIPFGFFSDRHPIMGYRRTIYILLGMLVAVSVLILSPWVGLWLADSVTTSMLIAGFGFFLLEGIGTFIAGTAFLALIAEKTTKEERGQATGLVWTMLFTGIILTGIGTSILLSEYDFVNLVTLFAVAGVIAVTLAVIALIGQEERVKGPVEDQRGRFIDALRTVGNSKSSRWFAAFLLLGLGAFFMQDVILEPFGGEVLRLTPSETTRFNVYMGVGLILSMLLGGMILIPRRGKRWVTELGCWILVITFAALAASSFFTSGMGLPLIIAFLGVGGGLFTVGGVAMMMDMTSAAHVGLFVGAWTLIQALARGPASLVGGGLFSAFSELGATAAQGYGAVFAIEMFVIFVSIFFLRRVAVKDFQREVVSLGAFAAEAMD
ncbi:MAG: MFS transporter [Anaerolineales bacterium]|nr:MFS transporter [Anaerolineales bacterium]